MFLERDRKVVLALLRLIELRTATDSDQQLLSYYNELKPLLEEQLRASKQHGPTKKVRAPNSEEDTDGRS